MSEQKKLVKEQMRINHSCNKTPNQENCEALKLIDKRYLDLEDSINILSEKLELTY